MFGMEWKELLLKEKIGGNDAVPSCQQQIYHAIERKTNSFFFWFDFHSSGKARF
jgi:hypothetical protein